MTGVQTCARPIYTGKSAPMLNVEVNGSQTAYSHEGSFVYISMLPLKGNTIRVSYKISLELDEISRDLFRYRHGSLLLAHIANDELVKRSELGEVLQENGSIYQTEAGKLFPLKNMFRCTDQEVKDTILQVLFPG